MNITNITTDDRVKYDPFLVETVVNTKDTEKSTTINTENKSKWESSILTNALIRMENNIQLTDDSSPLSFKLSPPVNNYSEALKVINEIDNDELKKNYDKVFNNLNIESISRLFISESDSKY